MRFICSCLPVSKPARATRRRNKLQPPEHSPSRQSNATKTSTPKATLFQNSASPPKPSGTTASVRNDSLKQIPTRQHHNNDADYTDDSSDFSSDMQSSNVSTNHDAASPQNRPTTSTDKLPEHVRASLSLDLTQLGIVSENDNNDNKMLDKKKQKKKAMQEMAEKCNFDNFASLIDGIELSASAPPAVPSVLPLVDPIDKHEALFYIEVNEKQERSVSTDNNHNVIHDDNDIKNNNNIKTCEETLDSLSDSRELDQLSPIKKPKEHHHNHQNHGTTTTESMLIDSDDVIIDDDTAATMLTHRVTFEEGYGGNTNTNTNNGNNEKENENDSDRQRTPLRSARRKRYISMNSYFVPIESAYHTPRTSGAGAAHCSSPSGNSNNNNNNNNNSNNNNNNSNNNLDSTVGSDSSEYIMMDNDARLRRAVLEGDEKRVRRYVCAKKANVNTVYPTTKQTCLHVAASRNYTGIMNILLENGASVDATDYLKSTPLHWACSKGQLEAAEVLLAHEASTHSRDRYGYSPFHLSIRNGHYHVAEALLMFGADINFKRSADGTTALHMAMAKGDLDAIRFLFHHGARLHIKDSNGDSCLFLAAGNNHVEAIKLIIECVMRKNLQHKSTSIEYTPIKKFLLTRDNTGGTLVHRAAREGHPEMIRFLLNIDNSFLRSVVAKYEFELEGNLQDLIRADPHKFEYELLKAAAADNMSAFSSIRQLSGLHQKSWQQRNTRIFNVDDQCLVPATSVYGCTALHIAAMHCRVQAAEVLLKMRASVNLRDKSAETALHKCFRGIALAQQLAAQSAAAASASSPQATTTTTTTAAAENDTQQQQQPHHQPNSSSGDTGIGYDDHDNDDYGPVNNNNNPIHNHSHNNDSSDHDTKGSWIHRRQSQATKAALRWRVSVRLPDTNDKNEFQLSAQRGAMIWLLLSNGANTRIKNNKGESCRHMMKKLNISVKLRK